MWYENLKRRQPEVPPGTKSVVFSHKGKRADYRKSDQQGLSLLAADQNDDGSSSEAAASGAQPSLAAAIVKVLLQYQQEKEARAAACSSALRSLVASYGQGHGDTQQQAPEALRE